MAGTYLEGSSKVLSGVYSLIKAAVSAVSLGARGIVAYPFTADWGPINVLTVTAYGSEFDKLFNAAGSSLTSGKISKHAFKGKPQQLLAYRMATSAAAKGTCTLDDAEAADSIVMETLYPSARSFVAAVKAGSTAGAVVIEITEGSVLLVSVEGSTVAALAAALNTSDYVRVTDTGDNMPAVTSGEAFAGGNNGSTVTEAEYTNFLTEIEADGTPNAFSFDAVEDEDILTLAETWVKRVRDEGMYITWARGGPLSWDNDMPSANAKSKALNWRGIINVGNGVDGYGAAEMAIFIAARVASIALNRTVTDEVIDYADVNKKLTPGQRIVAKQSGTLVFVKDGKSVLIDEGVGTLTAPHTDEVVEMGKIRVNNALDAVTKDLEAFGNEYKKSRSNTQEARITYAATVEDSYFRPLASLEVIKNDYFYIQDPEYHGKTAVFTPKIDEAFFFSGIWPVDSMERIYQKISVNF